MNAKLSQSGNAVAVSALKNLHFGNEALSWDNCFGPEADETCPAILICTLPPFYFIPTLLAKSDGGQESAETDVPWILLSLKDRGKDIDDLREIIEKVVDEVASGKDISNFDAVKVLRTIDDRPVINADIGVPGGRLSQADIFRRLGRRTIRGNRLKVGHEIERADKFHSIRNVWGVGAPYRNATTRDIAQPFHGR
jgi:hypothetical protein